MKRRVFLAALALTLTFGGTAFAQDKEQEPVKVAWSVWTGWMPFKLMQTEGFLEKREKELGVDVELVEFKGYMDSVTAFASEKVDACAMTSMEALQPASNGISTVAVVANDISNGGDGLLVAKGMTIESLKGERVLLEQFSVSHYLLSRALSENGISEGEVTIVNIPGDEAGKSFLTDESVKAVATWNPHLHNAVASGRGELIFDSSKIPGEIIDLLVFNEKTIKENPKAVQAVVLAWYDAVEMIENPKTRAKAIAAMADAAGSTTDEFENVLLKGTILFTKPSETVGLFSSKKLESTMGKIKKFSYDKELIKDADFKIGFGEKSEGLLKFDPTFAAAVAATQAPAADAAPAKSH